MSPQEERKFKKIYAMLDSPHQGERQAALEVIRERSAQFGWPSFGDTMRSLSETVPLARHQELEREFADLSAKLSGFGKLATLAVVVIAVGYGVYRALQPIGATSAAQSNSTSAPPTPAIARAGLPEMDSWQKWVANSTTEDVDYSPAIVHLLAGASDWPIAGRDGNETTGSDCYDKPITRHCIRYPADCATLDYTVPPPYVLGSLNWSKVVSPGHLPPIPAAKGNDMARLMPAFQLAKDCIPTLPFCF
jgi:hypothetical protein